MVLCTSVRPAPPIAADASFWGLKRSPRTARRRTMARREFTNTGMGKRYMPSDKNLRSLSADSRRKAKGADDDRENALRQRQ
ncbi:hypothetical protein RGR602_PC01647 (plasmid) [Rhizobium gallicum bv. gallicum R602sp]|uniref:Uncharacterized protein n=1 Tax=Rhizobium gallicum bv. gallicum R602sp TaxID=1041138 RepID=A0A0B4XF01_9HYPH|nr:hypothetical protein RGR602_PC01647 [Rhizobium gallicum bv. gallicum R602sp]